MPSLFSTPKTPTMPTPPPVTPMPDPDAQDKEKKRKLAEQLSTGRASTFLNQDTSGGSSASQKLGG